MSLDGCLAATVCYDGGVSTDAERLLGELLKLPASERVEVFDRLGAQLEVERGQSLSDAWRREIHRRISRLDEGEAALIPVEDVERDLWAEQLADEQAVVP